MGIIFKYMYISHLFEFYLYDMLSVINIVSKLMIRKIKIQQILFSIF